MIEWQVRYIDTFRERYLYTEENFNRKKDAMELYNRLSKCDKAEPELWRLERSKGNAR